MSYRKELCRNFQRGSCQYGERCKFIHATNQQQQRSGGGGGGFGGSSNTPFGFGSNQQQKPNNHPFGFGGQQQQRGVNKQQQFQPFENTWTRSSSAAASKQPDSQNQAAANHTCTDLDACKRLIAEDFEKERPLWNLTCYGHLKYGPCDVVGDLSREELRAAAYNEAKCGLPLQSIVERERNLLNSKLIEFENLLRNPYTPPSKSALPGQSMFQGMAANATPPQTAAPPSVSSFSQLGASLNTMSGFRPSVPTSTAFGQPIIVQNETQASGASNVSVQGQTNPFSHFSQTSNAFAVRPSVPSTNIFGQTSISTSTSQTSSAFNISPVANAGWFGTQSPTPQAGISTPSNTQEFGNVSINSSMNNALPSLAFPPQSFSSSGAHHPVMPKEPSSVSQAATSAQPANDVKNETVSVDANIWLKESWLPGEVPEEAPPDEYVF